MLVRVIENTNTEKDTAIRFLIHPSKRDERYYPRCAEFFDEQKNAGSIDPAQSLVELLNSQLFSSINNTCLDIGKLLPALKITTRSKRTHLDLETVESLSPLDKVMHMLSIDRSEDFLVHRICKLGALLREIKEIDTPEYDSIANNVIIRYFETEYIDSLTTVQKEYFSKSTFDPLLFRYGISAEYYTRLRLRGGPAINDTYVNNEIKKIILCDPTTDTVTKKLHEEIVMQCSQLSKEIIRHPKYQMNVEDKTPFLSLRAALEYHKLAITFQEASEWYELTTLDSFFAFAYIQCLKHNIRIRRCQVCGKYFVSHNGRKTCDSQETNCREVRKSQTKASRQANDTIDKANTVIKLYQNRISNIAGARSTTKGYDTLYDALPILELIQKYYQIICSYSNRQIMRGNYPWERTYVDWLTRIGNLPRGHLGKLIKEKLPITVYALILNGDGSAQIYDRSFKLNNEELKLLIEYLNELHKEDILGERIGALLKDSL